MSRFLLAAANDGRHQPASHPVRRRLILSDIRDCLGTGALPSVSAMSQAAISQQLERIAIEIASLPAGQPFTVAQRRDARCIARQLLRLAAAEGRHLDGDR